MAADPSEGSGGAHATDQEVGRALAEQRRAVVDAIDAIVCELDGESLQITFVNKQAERILGYSAEQWTSEPDFWIEHLHPEDRKWAIEAKLETAARGESRRMEYRMIAADGRTVWLRDILTTHVNVDRSTRLRCVKIDVTVEKHALERLRKSEARLAQAEELAHLGSWEWDVASGSLDWSNELYRIVGLKPGVDVGFQTVLGFVHPDDRATFEEIVRRAAECGESYVCDTRTLAPDGAIRVVQSRGAVAERDAQGRTTRMFGTVQDITERFAAEQAIRANEAKLRALTDRLVRVREQEAARIARDS